MYDIFKSIELDAAWLPALSEHAAGCGIAFAASAFDLPSLAALEGVAVPFHKVASSETTNLRLVGAMAATGKPLLLSTGMCRSAGRRVGKRVSVRVGLGGRRIIKKKKKKKKK